MLWNSVLQSVASRDSLELFSSLLFRLAAATTSVDDDNGILNMHFRYGKGMGIIGVLLGDDHRWNQPNGLFGVFHYSLMVMLS